jgi:thiamine pyrophosphokinase
MNEFNVIIANGEFPIHSYPLELIKKAKNIICTDGSAEKLLNINIQPDILIGDMDSIKINSANIKSKILVDKSENNTDLEKALIYYSENFNNEKLFILGATGLRDDHNFANLLLLNKFSEDLSIMFVTNYYKILVNKGKNIYPCKPSQQVSILPLKNINKVTTGGLKYELNESPLNTTSTGISNIAINNEFSINSSENVFVFIEI